MEKDKYSAKKVRKKERIKMYKQIFIILIVIVLIITSDILMQKNTDRTINNIIHKLDELREKMIDKNNGNYEDIKKEIDNIINMWKNEYNKLAYYLEHYELEKVETELTKLRANIEVEEYDTGIENIDTCIFVLKHISDKISFRIVNVF